MFLLLKTQFFVIEEVVKKKKEINVVERDIAFAHLCVTGLGD